MDETNGSTVTDEEPTSDLAPISSFQKVLAAVCYWPTVAFVFLAVVAVLAKANLNELPKDLLGVVSLVITWKVSMWGWRFLTRGRFRTGVLVGTLGWFYGPVYGVIALALVAVGATCSEFKREVQKELALQGEAEQFNTQQRGDSAGFLDYDRDSLRPGDGWSSTRFDRCIETLYDRGQDHRSEITWATAKLMKKGHSRELAEDVVQTAVLKTCVAHGNGKANDGLGRYFNVVLTYTVMDSYKRKGSDLFNRCEFVLLDPERDGSYADTPEETLRARQTQKVLRAAFCGLSSANRKALELQLEGLGTREIAVRLGVTEPTARQRLSRAKRELRRALEDM